MAIRTVGVAGCGLMGSGIAQVCAEAGYDVVVREVSDDLLKKGLGRIDSFLAKGVERGKVTPERRQEVMGRLRGTTEVKDLARAEVVIEAVVESLAAKRELFRRSTRCAGERRSSPRTPRRSRSPRWRR
jgi:3-hydroxybutyryl-CoA dehydrogenase